MRWWFDRDFGSCFRYAKTNVWLVFEYFVQDYLLDEGLIEASVDKDVWDTNTGVLRYQFNKSNGGDDSYFSGFIYLEAVGT